MHSITTSGSAGSLFLIEMHLRGLDTWCLAHRRLQVLEESPRVAFFHRTPSTGSTLQASVRCGHTR